MLHSFLKRIDKFKPIASVSAHCDIPCKIYDPINAQLATLTIIRMVDLIDQITFNKDSSKNEVTQLNRLIAQKEEHGIKVKYEISVIWGDYFKEKQIESFPEIHNLTHSIMLIASKAKQNIDKDASLELLKKVNRFAEIFWLSKNIKTYKALCPYPPEKEIIYPDLKS